MQWIKLVEKLDEGAFHRKHMFQVYIVPSGPLKAEEEAFTLYLQAGVSTGVVVMFVCTSLEVHHEEGKGEPGLHIS